MELRVIILFACVAGLYILGCSSQELARFKNKYYYRRVGWFSDGWFGALKACKSKNMELLKIESKDENDFVNKEVLRKGVNMDGYSGFCWWTAGTKFMQENRFYWSDTGTFINYTNWGNIYYPNATNYDFVAVSTRNDNSDLVWSTYYASYPCYLACERTVDFP